NRETFRILLRQFRRNAGLSQAMLAERAGMSETGIQALENARPGRANARPRTRTVLQLSNALGLTLSEQAAFLAAATGAVQEEPSGAPLLSLLPTPPTPIVGRSE